jgi:hypothetical protein
MPTRIDHVIAAASDFRGLEAAFVRLGFHVTGGGLHPWGGTRNRIVVLGDGYLELLGITDGGKVSPALANRLTKTGAGWIGLALQSLDIEREATEMRERGADVRGPKAGQLVAPSGAARGWHSATVGGDDLWLAAEPLPFLIQHHSRGAVHQMELAGAGGLAPHPNGAVRLAEVVVAVRDLGAARERFEAVYGLSVNGRARLDAELGAEVLALPLLSGERITLACPVGMGIAHERIEHAGDGVCRASVAADLEKTVSYLRGRGIAHAQGDTGIVVAENETAGIPLQFVTL